MEDLYTYLISFVRFNILIYIVDDKLNRLTIKSQGLAILSLRPEQLPAAAQLAQPIIHFDHVLDYIYLKKVWQ